MISDWHKADNDTNTPHKADTDTPHEALRYIGPTPYARLGTTGKSGFLRLGFECDASGRTILRDWERRVPLIVQQALYFDEQLPDMACVYILSSGGPNLDGDRYEQLFTLRRGAMVHLSTGAATKIAEMRHNYSSLRQHIRLEESSYLEYLPEPVIPCRHSRYISDTQITIAHSAVLLYGEIYLPGRRHYGRGERFEYDLLSVAMRVEREDGELLFREKFTVEPHRHHPQRRGAMGQYEIFANVVLIADEPIADDIYNATTPAIDHAEELLYGITRLPNHCGVQLKVLGNSTDKVKRIVRHFASRVRQRVKHKPLRDDFVWR